MSEQDATWLNAPGSADFDNASNWSSGAVPAGIATFDQSSVTALLFQASSTTSVSTFVFNPDAPSYSFSLIGNITENGLQVPSLSFSNLGIINDSSFAPSFVITLGNLSFLNSSNAGNASFTISGVITSAGSIYDADLNFENTSSAGSATIINNPDGGITNFYDSSTAGAANVVNNFNVSFFGTSNAGTAKIANTAAEIIVNGNARSHLAPLYFLIPLRQQMRQ
jgi:hypothetical protein